MNAPIRLTARGKFEVPPPQLLEVRDLTRDDIKLLEAPRQKAVAKTFRTSHHRLARMLAIGMRAAEIARKGVYSHTRINTLMADPAFRDLVSKYEKDVDAKWEASVDEYAELAVGNMTRAELMLADKLDALDEEGDTASIRELVAITSDRADRFGYGRHSTQTNVNVDFASKLEAAVRRSGKTIESVVPPQPPRTVGAQRPSSPLPPPPSHTPVDSPTLAPQEQVTVDKPPAPALRRL